MSAVHARDRIPGCRAIAVASVTALSTLGLALLPGDEADAVDVSGPCAVEGAPGFGEGPMNPEYIRPEGHKKATMIMVDFSDIPAKSPARERSSFFSDYGKRYLDKSSYGKYKLDLAPTRSWVRMPSAWSSYDIRRGIKAEVMRVYVQDAIDAASAQGTDFSDTDFVYVVADDNVPAQPTVSQANTFDTLRAGTREIRGAALVFGRRADSATWQRGNFVHEANHLYGLPDLYNSENGASVEFAGGWDTMSMAGISDLMGWHKWKFGWLSSRQVECVSEPGTSTHSLKPIGSPDGANIVAVKTGPSSVIVAEARTKTGLDAKICGEGVLLYTVNSRIETGRGPVRVVDSMPHSKGGDACADRSPVELAELGDAPFRAGTGHSFAGGVRVEVTDAAESPGARYTVRVSKP